MYCNKNAKIIAAIAALAMMFAGFGVLITAGASDAEGEEPGTPGVTENASVEPTAISWKVSNGDEGIVITYTIPKIVTVEEVVEIVGDKNVDVTINAKVTLNDGYALEDIPTKYAKFLDANGELISIDAEVYEKISEGLEAYITLGDATTTVNYVVAGAGTLYTDEEIAALVDGLFTEDDVNDAVADAVAAYEGFVSPEDLEKAIADAKAEAEVVDEKDGDATIAWCVAALGIIAAVALAGFVLIIFRKANKEGRRLI